MRILPVLHEPVGSRRFSGFLLFFVATYPIFPYLFHIARESPLSTVVEMFGRDRHNCRQVVPGIHHRLIVSGRTIVNSAVVQLGAFTRSLSLSVIVRTMQGAICRVAILEDSQLFSRSRQHAHKLTERKSALSYIGLKIMRASRVPVAGS
jgi:hypothetical protein